MWKISASLNDSGLVPEAHTSDSTSWLWVERRQQGNRQDGILAVKEKNWVKQLSLTCLCPPQQAILQALPMEAVPGYVSNDSDFLSLNFGMELGFIYLHICCFSKRKWMETFAAGLSLTIPINSVSLLVREGERLTKSTGSLWVVHLPSNNFQDLPTSLRGDSFPHGS